MGAKGLAEKATKKGVETMTDLTLGNIGRITKWTAGKLFHVFVKTPAKMAGKALLSVPIIPGPKSK